jgi:cytochrome c oxidase subunit 1
MALGFGMTAVCLVSSLFGGKKAPANPWGGRTLEWQCASPPPFDNFAKTPRVADPYDFSVVKWDEKTQGYWVDDAADPEMNPNAPKGAHAHH